MTCPDWKTLAAWRDDPRAEEPAEWQDALAHLDRGCALCRRAALSSDPTLVFRRLAAPVATPNRPASAAQEASDVESMRRAVAAMRAAGRVEAAGRKGRRVSHLGWKHWAAAAALAVASLSLPGDDAHRLRQAPPPVFAVPAVLSQNEMAVYLPAGMPDGAAGADRMSDDTPILEGVNLEDARLYQFENDELAVVMVVAESLGV